MQISNISEGKTTFSIEKLVDKQCNIQILRLGFCYKIYKIKFHSMRIPPEQQNEIKKAGMETNLKRKRKGK